MRKKHKTAAAVKHNLTCPYCGGAVKIRPAETVYGTGRGIGEQLYVCENYPQCDSYIRADKNKPGSPPLGTPANAALRRKRVEVHAVMDQIWKKRYMTRAAVYNWLADEMCLNDRGAHIGNFDLVQCLAAISICKKKLRELQKYAA